MTTRRPLITMRTVTSSTLFRLGHRPNTLLGRTSWHRHTHSHAHPPLPPPPSINSRSRRPYALYTSLGLSLLGLGLITPSLIHADSDAPLTVSLTPGEEYSDTTLSALIRSYVVFTMCSFPRLVDASPWFMDLAKVPVLGSVVRGVVRWTFFNHVRLLHITLLEL
jgi:hypothetical protein